MDGAIRVKKGHPEKARVIHDEQSGLFRMTLPQA